MSRNFKQLIGSRAKPVLLSGRARGFTLVEVIMATTITSLLIVGVLSFYLTSYKIGFVNRERNEINSDIRSLTSSLLRDGRQSNYFVIYTSIAAGDRNDASDRRLDGQSGDLLVFVYSEETGDMMSPTKINRVVAYYRGDMVAGGEGLAPVKRYERVIHPPSSQTIESLLPSVSVLNQADDVVELAKGLANNQLFYNFWGRSVMVNGQIYHGNAAKRVTETYNFTVSPRG